MENENFSDLCKKILIHIFKYGPDSPKYMVYRLLGESGWEKKYDIDELKIACEKLENKGLIEIYKGSLKNLKTSSIKPWIKIKVKNRENKPPGIFYDLTKEGKKVASRLYKEYRLKKL